MNEICRNCENLIPTTLGFMCNFGGHYIDVSLNGWCPRFVRDDMFGYASELSDLEDSEKKRPSKIDYSGLL